MAKEGDVGCTYDEESRQLDNSNEALAKQAKAMFLAFTKNFEKDILLFFMAFMYLKI